MKIGTKTRTKLCAGILLIISMKVCLVVGLTCIQCHTRLHKGCTNLDYTVRHQECVGDEVCAKFSIWHMKRVNGVMIPYGRGTIRDCLKPDPDGLNTCLRFGNEMEPKEKCFCNSTDFCNGAPGGRHQYNNSIPDNWKLILISFLIYHCFLFAFSGLK